MGSGIKVVEVVFCLDLACLLRLLVVLMEDGMKGAKVYDTTCQLAW